MLASLWVVSAGGGWRGSSRVVGLSLIALLLAALLAVSPRTEAQAQDQYEETVWSTTLNVQTLVATLRGCDNTASSTGRKCFNRLSGGDGASFVFNGVTYHIRRLFVAGSRLQISFSLSAERNAPHVDPPALLRASGTLHVGANSYDLSDAVSGSNTIYWENAGISWSTNQQVQLRLTWTFDRPTTVSLTADGPLVEGGGPVTVTATVDRPVSTRVHVRLGGTATFGGSMKETSALNAGALALLRRVAPNHRLLNLPPPAGSDYWTPGEGIFRTHGVGQLTIPAGATSTSFQITVLPDAVTDPDETVTIDAMLRDPDTTNCVQQVVEGSTQTVCTGWAGLFYGNKAQTLTLTIADRPATAGEQHNAPPLQNQQPEPQPQIPPPAEPQPQQGDPNPQPESAEPEPDPGPQPESEPQPAPEPQPVLQPQQDKPADPVKSQPQLQVREVESPEAVAGLVLTATANTVTATWQAPTSGGVPENYIVQLKAPRGEKGKHRKIDAAKTSTTFRNLTPGATYKIRVRSQNEAGKSKRVKAIITTTPKS